jgi:site-specific recombinase XerD
MTEQLPLFSRKKFAVTLTQGEAISPPTPASSVLSTLPAYFAYLQTQGYSQYTPSDFCYDVKKLGLFLKEKRLSEITVQDVRQWLSKLRSEERMTEKTISRKLSALSNYFTWLQSEKVLTKNPALAIPNRKITSPLPEILFDAECSRLLEVASRDARTYLLVALLLETGIKTEELMDLKLNNIDVSNKYAPEVWVKHTGKKVKKDRKLKLPREVVSVLDDYVDWYNIDDRLFPFTMRTLQYLLASTAEAANLQKHVSAQLLRDTCAVRMLKAGEPIEVVLRNWGLSETTWEDAKEKYLKLVSQAL